jgi:diguanylate cyclase (GGDEF)-like protein/PAS domain S-box-containing protein
MEIQELEATSGLNVGHLTRRSILECAPDTSVVEAARRMHEAHCGSIIVVDNGRVVGIWTEYDVLRLDLSVIATLDLPVAQFMTKPVKTIGESESIQSLTFRLERERIRHLLVIDQAGNRVGVVSQSDVVNNQGIEFFVQMKDVGSIMKKSPLVISGNLPVNEMIAMMARFKQYAAIVDHEGELGIFTEVDALRIIGHRLHALVAHQAASFPLVTVTLATSLYKARNVFAERQVRHLGVVSDSGLVGILTYSDILVSVERAYVKELQEALGAQAHELLLSRRTLSLAQTVAASTFQGIVIADATGFVESVNPAYTSITGYTPSETIGRNPRLLMSSRQSEAFFKQIFDALVRHSVWSGELWVRRKNGEEFPGLATLTAVRGDAGEITNYVGVFSDLSEQKRYQEEVQVIRRKLEGQEDLNRLMLDTLPVIATIKDANGRYVVVNERATEFCGFAREELIGRNDYEIFSVETAEQLREGDHQAQSLPSLVKEIRISHRGAERYLLTHKQAVTINGEHYVIGASVDITERKQAEQRAEDEREILSMIARIRDLPEILDAICVRMERHLHGGKASIMILEEDGIHLRIGAAPGLPPAYLNAIEGLEIGQQAGSCGTAVYSRQTTIAEDIASDARWAAYRDLALDHGLRACWSFPILSSESKALGTFALYYRSPRRPTRHELALVDEVTHLASIALERAQATEQLYRMATVDMLTNIANRQQLLATCQRELARAQRSHHPLSLCMIDIDHFKSFNDNYGHAVGDTVLKGVAALLVKALRGVDTCGRYGGEEFVALLPETDASASRLVAERVRATIAQASFAVGNALDLQVTVSIGLCAMTPGESLEQLLIRADTALYEAKRSGRNRVISGAASGAVSAP